MKFLKKLFLNYAALILLLPFSYSVGVYVFRSFEVLKDNPSLLYFYILFALSPLYFFLFSPDQRLGKEVAEVLGGFIDRFLYKKWAYLIIGIVFSFIFLYMGSIHISTYILRDEWILQDSLPILPIDLIVLPRLALLFVGLFPIDIVIPFINLLFIFFWLCFLIYVTPKGKYPWVFVLLVSTTAFTAVVLGPILFANFEFNSALFSFVGMYGIWRKKYNLGLFLLIMGAIFKNTGLFHVATGGFFLMFVLWQTGNLSFGKIRNILDIPLSLFLGFYLVMNHWGQFYYVYVDRGGPSYIVSSTSEYIFWFSSFFTFIFSMYQNGQVTFILSLVGILLSKEKRIFAAFSLGLLLVLRSFSTLADAQYATMFLPVLSYFSLIGIVQLWTSIHQKKVQMILYVFLLVFNMYTIGWMMFYANTPGGMNHKNSNFDEFITKLARRFPEDGYIYQKSISLVPYLREARGGDLDAIRFRPFPETRHEALSELSLPGCRLVIVDRDALEFIGISEKDFANMGYSEHPYVLADSSGTWVSYSKECNLWEYN